MKAFFVLDIEVTTMFAVGAILVTVVRYGIYLYTIYKGETRPHVFTWFNWGVVVGIGAYVQYQAGGGLSAGVLAVVAGTCLFIAGLALFVGEKDIRLSDWFAFVGALVAIPVWVATKEPLAAMVVLMLIDVFTYYPTIRKSWGNPWGEPPGSYVWAGSRYFLTLFTIEEPTFEKLVYVLFLMLSDWGFAVYVYWRRGVVVREGVG